MQIDGEVVDRGQDVAVVLTEHPAAAGEGPFMQGAGNARFSPRVQVGAGPVEQPGHILTGWVQGAVGVGRGQHMGQQRSSVRPGGWIVPRVGGHRPCQQPDDDRCPTPAVLIFLVVVGAGAQQCRRHSVYLDAVRCHSGHSPPPQYRGHLGEHQRVPGRGAQRGG